MPDRIKNLLMVVATSVGFVLVLLRALGVIGWSWWLVTIPLWPAAAVVAFWLIAFCLLFIHERRGEP